MKTPYYSEFLHFYIPQIKFSKNPSLLVHLHGFNLENYDHFSKKFGDYGNYLLESKANSILVIPESRGKCETYNSFFQSEKRTEDFFSGLKKTITALTSETTNSLILSGHSGAYKSLNQILIYKNIFQDVKAIGLFDATYGDTGQIEKWALENGKENSDFIFYNAYVTGKKATAEEGSLKLAKHLQIIDSPNIILLPITGVGETLDQHFLISKNGSLKKFWEKTSHL